MDQKFGDRISLSIYKAMEPTLRYSTAHLPLRKHEDFNSIRGISLPTGHDIIGMCSDGVGTKSSFALEYGDWSGIGFDLLAMVCDDVVAIGAMPQAITTTIDVAISKPALSTTCPSLYTIILNNDKELSTSFKFNFEKSLL